MDGVEQAVEPSILESKWDIFLTLRRKVIWTAGLEPLGLILDVGPGLDPLQQMKQNAGFERLGEMAN